jgi:hypothetical protein
MGVRILEFILYLAVSYGVIYFLVGTKRAGEGSKELLANPVLIAAVVAIIVVGAMLVGPLPTVFLTIALFAFIAYLRSSDVPPLDGATARELLARLQPMAVSGTALLRRGLALGIARGAEFARGPALAEARGRLKGAVAKLEGYVRSRLRKSGGKSNATGNSSVDEVRPAQAQTPVPLEPEPPPPVLSLAEGHGLDAVRAALEASKPAGLTREQAKRLLDHLEGR